MENLYIVGNWKANKSEPEIIAWFETFKTNLPPSSDLESKKIIVCPVFPGISSAKKLVQEFNLPIDLGSQDISRFGAGAYTGEVPITSIKDLISHSIIGHSERRKYFSETDDILKEKVSNANSAGIHPIFCVQDENTLIPSEVKIVAYEPVFAIGSGKPDTPENAESVAAKIKEKNPDVEHVLYGGSVTSENVKSFTDTPSISGVLVGGASLDPASFLAIIKAC